MRRGDAGVTLIEVLVAVTLLSLLSLGMVMAIRIGLSAYTKTQTKLMDTRRVVGAQRIVQSELEGLIPALIQCGGGGSVQTGSPPVVLFQGTPEGMWMVSAFSLSQGWRGQPQVLQFFVMPGIGGSRLVVNEIPYTGAAGAGQYCTGTVPIPNTISRLPQMIPIRAGPQTFVLADKLAFCRFSYYTPGSQMNQPPAWQPVWDAKGWPLAIRIEMAPAVEDPSHVEPISITAPLHIRRDPEKVTTDGN